MPAIATFALLVQAAMVPAHSAELRGEELMDSLRAGGYTILLRHARTDRSFREEMGAVPAERSRQRNLNDDGVRDAKLMRAVLGKYRIPIGEIIASPMYRTRETAEYAAGVPTSITMALRVFPSNAEQAAVVAAPPPAGSNRLLVTHHFVIETHVPGIRPGEIAESEAAIVRPIGDGRVALVGRITLSDWERLGGVAEQASPAAGASTYASTHGIAPAPVHLVELPDTRAGRLARGYLDAFNSGDESRVRRFIDSSLVPDPHRPTDVRVGSYRQSFERIGRLTAIAVQASADDELAIVARGREGEYLLTVRTSAEHADRAASITIALGTTGGRHP